MTPWPGLQRSESRRYPAEATTARSVRRWAAGCFAAWGVDGTSDDAVLVLSELVTNAVVHGEGDVDVRVAQTSGALRIEVSDAGPGQPRQQVPRPDQATGRGLRIVTHLASVWGVHHGEHGKTVWAELFHRR